MKLDTYLQGVHSVAVSGHVRPDGDCVGSCLAAYNYITTCYPSIQVDVYLESVIEKFSFLKNADKIRQIPPEPEERQYDLFLVLDCGDVSRLGDAAQYYHTAKQRICIDHHVSNSSFADCNLVEPDASSTCELLFGVFDRRKITKEIAECLYVGLVTDTGVFQYSCTSAHTMQVGGELMNCGIDYPWIVTHTFFEKTYQEQRILGHSLEKSVLHQDGKVISCMLSGAELKDYGVTPDDLDGIASAMRNTKDVEVSVFLYENPDGTYKLSLRSGSYVDVAAIASAYGGGGHVRAAGATIYDPPQQVLQDLLRDIRLQIEAHETADA